MRIPYLLRVLSVLFGTVVAGDPPLGRAWWA
jgi:hypothetical protein